MSKPPGGGLVSRLLATGLAAVIVTGCTGGGEPDRPSPDPSEPTAGGTVEPDLSTRPVPRTELCGRLPPKAVEQALGAPVAGTDHYTNGDEVEVAPGLTDVVHEYGCVYRAADRTTARLWVFAPPVSRSEAEQLVRRARRDRGCSYPDTVPFGEPFVASICTRPAAGRGQAAAGVLRARLQGLFGESWVGCEVATPRGASDVADRPDERSAQSLMRRTDQWCTAAVVAASTEE